jgi:hypothetical protein
MTAKRLPSDGRFRPEAESAYEHWSANRQHLPLQIPDNRFRLLALKPLF